ncbi:putative homeobox-leucine zipper protein GLAB [Helianthus annuus]|nr:putative homeobox-leucine zipper protein GLAB [Helianthus annuus]
MKEFLKNPHKSIFEHKICIENARLKEKIRAMTIQYNQTYGINETRMGIDMAIQTKSYLKLAPYAMDELFKLGALNDPLWNKSTHGQGETLDFKLYEWAFPPCLGPKPHGFVSEASRAKGVIPMATSDFVEALFNADRWRDMFGGMIGRCTTKVISNGARGSRNGALLLMKAEIQVISSFVPVRVLNFIRYVNKHAEGLWVVVDYSVDFGTDGRLTRRCPSGCILQSIPNGFTKVTWIEHTEYDEQLIHENYRGLIRSGVGFGAQRWVSALLGQCKCIAPNLFESTTRCLRSLAQRMRRMFCATVCLTSWERWNLVANVPGRPRIMARMYNDFQGVSGVVMSATHSVWIAANHRHLFEMMLIKDLRSVWDVLCHTIATRDMYSFPLSQDEANFNCVSILDSNTLQAGVNQPLKVLQEASSDTTGSLIVYAIVDTPTVALVMHGGDSSRVGLLPIGLSIVPYHGESGESGSMVTVGFHRLLRNQVLSNITMQNINTLNRLVAETVQGLKMLVDPLNEEGM